MKKKKTYIFNEETLKNLHNLKEITCQTEIQIISDALDLYCEVKGKENEFLSKFDYMIEKLESLSLEIKKCVERIKSLEEKLEEKNK